VTPPTGHPLNFKRNPQEINWKGQRVVWLQHSLTSTQGLLLNLVSTEGSWLTYQRNPESEGLVLPLWSLTLISSPVTSAVYVWTLSHWSVSLSQTHMTSKLCRWLGGSVQRIHTPYFYSVNFSCLSPIFSL